MKLFTELMKNNDKRSVLIEFGFGNVNKSEVEKVGKRNTSRNILWN